MLSTARSLHHDYGAGKGRRGSALVAAGAPASRPARMTQAPEPGPSDEHLVELWREAPEAERDELLDELFGRYYRRVGAWCFRLTGDADATAEATQDVFLRVQSRLEGFRAASRFSTWLYAVTRSVVINREVKEDLRRMPSTDETAFPEPVDEGPSLDEAVTRAESAEVLRRAVAETLDELEAKVLYLHVVDGFTLPEIGRLYQLTNRSGAKAVFLRAKRKLQKVLPKKGLEGATP